MIPPHTARLLIILGYLAGQRATGREKPVMPDYATVDRLLAELERITKG